MRHGDHDDEASTKTHWSYREIPKGPGEAFFWYEDWNLDDVPSSDELRQDPDVQTCLQKLGTLSRKDLSTLPGIYGYPTGRRIPLFQSDTGDEYQVLLERYISMPDLWCPFDEASWGRSPSLLFTLEPMNQDTTVGEVPLPRYVIPFGTLEVRTNSRVPEYFGRMEDGDEDDNMYTERTDYVVMIDAEKEDMPLWLFVNQQALRDRALPIAHEEGIPTLPIFKGLLLDEGGGFYDCACILPSIHCLDPQRQQSYTFEECCESILKTRSIREPALLWHDDEAVENLLAGNLPLTPLRDVQVQTGTDKPGNTTPPAREVTPASEATTKCEATPTSEETPSRIQSSSLAPSKTAKESRECCIF